MKSSSSTVCYFSYLCLVYAFDRIETINPILLSKLESTTMLLQARFSISSLCVSLYYFPFEKGGLMYVYIAKEPISLLGEEVTQVGAR